MAIGAHERLDQLLVKKYQDLKVDNPIIQSSMINPNKMMDTLNDYANAHMQAFRIQQSLKEVCSKAVSINIQYTNIKAKTSKERLKEAAKKVVAAQMAKKNALMEKLKKEPRPEVA